MKAAGARWVSVLVAACLLATCGREIDSRPDDARRATSGASTTPTERTLGASPEAGRGYRTNLYTERDADVHALFEPEGAETSFVKSIHVDLGTRVGAGQVLAVLEDTRAAIAVERATARVDEARAQATRAEQLLEGELVPRAEYESLSNALRVTEAELKQAQLELARTRIRAPFAGVIARRYARVGQQVEPETPLFRVTAMAPLRAQILVPEREAIAFRSARSVRVTDVEGATAEGRIVVISPTVDPSSGTREIVVELRDPSGFLPGAEVIVEPVLPEDE